MNNTFMEGDVVIANKLLYGSRVPITPLSIHIGNTKKYLDWITLPYVRLWGFGNIKQNDVLVFNLPTEKQLPIDERTPMIKRCAALPGDFIKIDKGDVFINGILKKEDEYLKWYSITTLNTTVNTSCLDKYLKNNTPKTTDSLIIIDTYISQNTMDSLQKCNSQLNFQKKHVPKETYSPTLYPNNPSIKWNLDHLGSLYIPKKGQTIPINKASMILYKNIIEVYENNVITYSGDTLKINGTIATSYTFKLNYYFVLGDNRYNSIDSRYWGLLPENHIIGIVR